MSGEDSIVETRRLSMSNGISRRAFEATLLGVGFAAIPRAGAAAGIARIPFGTLIGAHSSTR